MSTQNTTNRFHQWAFLLGFLFLLSACEDVIEIDLNSANPVIVADGTLEADSLIKFRLSYTTDYFDAESPVYIENAQVVLSDQSGNTDTLRYDSEGWYSGTKIQGFYSATYTLSFIHSGQGYKAVSTLHRPTQISAIWSEEEEKFRPGSSEKQFSIHLKFTDNSETVNYYLIDFHNLEETSEPVSYTLIKSSYFTKNDTIEYSPVRKRFKENEQVTITIYSIDEATYTYYRQLNDLISGGLQGTSTPYNPQSNFGNRVMGYFKAWSFVRDTVIVQ